MIITDIKQLREVPVEETAVIVLEVKVVRADSECYEPCVNCLFDGLFCSSCCYVDRPDKEEVKFVKV